MSETCATCCHHAAASPPMYGVLLTSRNGRAPRAASVFTKARTFWRYCVFASAQGVGRLLPNSSFNAIHGVEHAVCAAA